MRLHASNHSWNIPYYIPLPDIPITDCVYGFTEEDRICGDVTGSPEKPEVKGIRQGDSYTGTDKGSENRIQEDWSHSA